jgi:hypothetical protein
LAIHDQITDEERSIVKFVEAHVEKRGMYLALAMVRKLETKPADIRAVIAYYRDLWRRQQRAPLRLQRR